MEHHPPFEHFCLIKDHLETIWRGKNDEQLASNCLERVFSIRSEDAGILSQGELSLL